MTDGQRFDFEPFLVQARHFLAGFRIDPGVDPALPIDGAFASRHGGAADLYGSADAAYALWIMGDLEERSTAESRSSWAAHIQAFQDPATGWFDRSPLPGHGVAHATAFAVGALGLLGARPTSPLHYAHDLFGDRRRIDAWLDGFRWSQIWTGSHAAGAAAAVIDAPDGVALPDRWSDDLLAALSERLDPGTGFWKRAPHDRIFWRPTTLDLGGAAHFWWLYDRLGHAIPCPELVIEGLLRLQRRSGLWGNRIFGGAFPQGIDFDALHGLRVAWRDADADFKHRHRDAVECCLTRYARAAHRWLTPPGAVDRLFRSVHKLVGTLDALAELDAAGEAVLGYRFTLTHQPLRSALTTVSWQ